MQQGSGEHGLKVWSTQVRLVLPELLFEVNFALDKKGGISRGGVRWQSDAWREELEHGVSLRSGACSKVEES